MNPLETPSQTVTGTALALFLYDLAEEIQLEELRQRLGAQTVQKGVAKHPAPEYVGFEHPPVVEYLSKVCSFGQVSLDVQFKYYDYGVVSVMFELPFSDTWDGLVQLAGKWMFESDLEGKALDVVRQRIEPARPALIRPYTQWLSEDYYIFHLREMVGNPTASELLSRHGTQIAMVVRGETADLADAEKAEVLQSSLSYYPTDLVVVGWNGALIYDTPAGARAAIQILEYANSQLLEFRHYDELLTRELNNVYRSLKRRTGLRAKWRLASEASRLEATTVEVTELVERTDNAIKFLSDMFAARLYRLAASKVGVPDYKNLVKQKLQTAEELYRYMTEEFHQGRTFLLELMVVIILVIELFYLFRGKG
ncbi:MAG TPA: hypothetical protein VEG30_08550 [Terriglobales bacterium]|nr:hypothetical protein [Terriglobales bacterium]